MYATAGGRARAFIPSVKWATSAGAIIRRRLLFATLRSGQASTMSPRSSMAFLLYLYLCVSGAGMGMCAVGQLAPSLFEAVVLGGGHRF